VSRNITVGIDVGTETVKVVVAELVRGKEKTVPKVIATGIADSKGLRHGYITSPGDVVRAIRQAVRMAEKNLDFPIKKAFLAVGGLGVTGTTTQGSVIVSRGDSEITDLDVQKALEACEAELPSTFILTLTKTQKIAGCVLANIGAETVSIVTYENNIPISLEVFPIGSTDITHDIALGLKMTLEEAEILKLGGTNHDITYSKKKLEEIVDARLSDIFELIETHLKRIGRSGLLPAGIVMTGGGAQTANIELAAKASLRLPARLATTGFEGDTKGLSPSIWTTANGLCFFGFTQGNEPSIGIKITQKAKNNIMAWIKQFLP
jgi:cell division ATPase FtsA